MKLQELLITRSENKCELCNSTAPLKLYEVLAQQRLNEDDCIMICNKCFAQIEKKEETVSQYWNFLTETMWSKVSGILVIACRLLNHFRNESWATENLDVMYLTEKTLT